MKYMLVALPLFLASFAHTEPTQYNCEDTILKVDIAPSWKAILDVDMVNGDFHSFTIKGKTLMDLEVTSAKDIRAENKGRYHEDAPMILAYGVPETYRVSIYGKDAESNVGDTIFVIPPNSLNGYFCYKNGSPIDTRLTKIRVNHNKWVYEEMNK